MHISADGRRADVVNMWLTWHSCLVCCLSHMQSACCGLSCCCWSNVHASAAALCRHLWMTKHPLQLTRWSKNELAKKSVYFLLFFFEVKQRQFVWLQSNVSVLLTASEHMSPCNCTRFWPNDGKIALVYSLQPRWWKHTCFACSFINMLKVRFKFTLNLIETHLLAA